MYNILTIPTIFVLIIINVISVAYNRFSNTMSYRCFQVQNNNNNNKTLQFLFISNEFGNFFLVFIKTTDLV